MMTRTAAFPSRIADLPGFDRTTSLLDPHAAKAIELLSRGNHMPDAEVEVVRRQYAAGRKPFLGEMEDVAQICHVQGSGADVPSMTILKPYGVPAEQKLLPALVYFHGGGWTLGGLDTYEPLCRRIANATGRAVVFVHYRLAPEHPFPAAIEDAWNAIDWVAANGTWIGIDRNQIAIGGDSAGGNLAAVAALAARDGLIDVTPEFQLLIYPCLDFTASLPSHTELSEGYLLTSELYAWYRQNYIGAFPDPADWHLSPLLAEDVSKVAPAVVLYAGFDPLRDEAARYGARLFDAGVPVEPLFFPNMIHGFMTLGGIIPAADVAVRRIALAIKSLKRARQPDPDIRTEEVRSGPQRLLVPATL
jgi:acetyl esterase